MKEEEVKNINDPKDDSGPLLRANRVVKIGPETNYSRGSIEGFGIAQLCKQGYVEGQSMGRNGLSKPIEFIPRHFRLGLGATPLPSMRISGGTQSEGGEREKGELKSSNYKYTGEKIKSKTTPGTGIVINKGKYEGMHGRVLGLEKDSNTILVIELLANDERVKVSKENVSIAEEKPKKSPPREKHKRKKRELRWVLPGILIRVVSKEYEGGRYYNKKLGVEDVPNKWSFTLVTESGNFLEDLAEDDIETVMPHLMEDVIILKESNRGEIGKLIMRDKKKNIVKIQLYDKPDTVLQCTQDDCCALHNKKLFD
eukprot:TRINITY_DN679_c0_g2_i4.p1 TRINITY_DN679_c0_g2~~TRINITY_DN679_c0_g2_i4.p1  ORF type:complete len:312 (-),score=86.49 TRINITY_DN679_c0_g2_i4:159-1094(-)